MTGSPPAAFAGCLAFTAERGWHFATVDLHELVRCEIEANSHPSRTRARSLAPCGTHAAFIRHRYRGEVPCDPCRRAETVYQRERGRARRAAARRRAA